MQLHGDRSVAEMEDVSKVLMCYYGCVSLKPSPPTRSRGRMMIQVLPCPNCQGTDIVRHDQTRQGKQRYYCREPRCAGCTFLLADRYPGHSPEVRQQIVEIARKASGIRDTARVLHVSTNTVMTELKKGQAILQVLHLEHVEVERYRSEALERWRGFPSALDDMWSDVRSTATPRGWWQAIDQRTGQGLGEVLGPRQEAVFVKWQAR